MTDLLHARTAISMGGGRGVKIKDILIVKDVENLSDEAQGQNINAMFEEFTKPAPNRGSVVRGTR